MEKQKKILCIAFLSMLVLTMLLLNGCFTSQFGIKLFSTTIKVLDQNGKPLVGAVVSSSNGERLTVDASGEVKLHFGNAGGYTVSVMFQDKMIASYNISIPGDQGKAFTAQYVPPTVPSANSSGMGGASPQAASPTAPSANGGSTESASPQMMSAMYPMLFQYLFSAYGYNVDVASYNPGEWTAWVITTGNNDKTMNIQKAFLTRLDNGNEWWQMSLNSGDKNKIMMEVMFNAKRSSLRRMRQKIGDDAPKEVPVTEGWYTAPMQLTPESLDGAVVQRGVSVVVPAGTFTSDIAEFGMASGLTLRVWRCSSVPGGVVKYVMVNQDKEIYSVALTGFGSGAKSELGSY